MMRLVNLFFLHFQNIKQRWQTTPPYQQQLLLPRHNAIVVEVIAGRPVVRQSR